MSGAPVIKNGVSLKIVNLKIVSQKIVSLKIINLKVKRGPPPRRG